MTSRAGTAPLWTWGPPPPALRDAVTMFSGALDDIGRSPDRGRHGLQRADDVCSARFHGWRCRFSFIGVPAAPAQVNEMSDILEAFEQVRAELGVTQKQMFKATGIKHRTYHSWKCKAPDTRPRAASQGRFWRLVDVLDDLRDAVDRPLGQWLSGAPERLSAFLYGRFDDLVDIAVNRPPYPKRSVGDSVYARHRRGNRHTDHPHGQDQHHRCRGWNLTLALDDLLPEDLGPPMSLPRSTAGARDTSSQPRRGLARSRRGRRSCDTRFGARNSRQPASQVGCVR